MTDSRGASPHVVYLASAGTGKTHQLTNRYIELLVKGVEPHTILATTFTRKAAGEILERILKRLSAAAISDDGLRELRRSIDPSLTHERCAALTAKLAHSLHRLSIGTIDSFFASVMRGFALDLAAPPNWTIVDEEPDRDLRSMAVTQAIDGADRGKAIERVRTLVKMLYKGGFGRGVHSRILQCVTDWYGTSLSSLSRPGTWEVYRPAGRGPTAEEAAGLAEAVQHIVPPNNKSGEPNKNWVKELPKLSRRIRDGAWEGVATHGLVAAVAEGGDKYYGTAIPADARLQVERVFSAARDALLTLLLDRNTAARDLLTDFDAAYTALKQRKGVLRFDDVPRAILGAEAHGRLDDLYYRLDARIQHLLLDEFQDTSLEQFEVLKPLLDNLASGDEGSVLCVGDVKQSLYSWRGGEPRLLPAIPERWPQFEPRPLTVNRRSSPAIIDAVNAVFETIANNAALADSPGAAAVWGEMFERHRAHQEKLPGLAQLVVAPALASDRDDSADDDCDDAPADRVALIADRAVAIAAEAPSATIAILTRTNKLIPGLILALRERGLAAVGEHGNPLTDSPAAAAAISALHLADHPGDSAALFHLAVTPFGPLLGSAWSLDRKVMQVRGRRVAARLRARIGRDGIAEFLRWLQRRLEPAMDEFGHARFDQLIDLAEDSAGLSPSEFARLARERPVEPPPHDGDPIRIMTVHKAKGLEFDAVILPELDKVWRTHTDSVLTDRRGERGERDPLSPIAAVTTWPSEPYQVVAPELRELCEAHTQRQHAEELCLLYVAMTRAKRRLDMIVFPPGKGRSGLSAQRVLCEAVAPGKAVDAGAVLWDARTEEVWHHDLAPRGVRPPAERLEVRLASPTSIPAGRLARTSPSSLEGGDRVQLDELWRPVSAKDGPDPRDRGTAFHAMFEAIEWLDDGRPDAAKLADELASLGIGGAASGAWVEQFLACLRGDVAAALSRGRYRARAGDAEVRREWSFAVREAVRPGDASHGEHIMNGTIDRLVIGREAGGRGRSARPVWAEIIDFKTDAIREGDDAALAGSVEHYRPQIEAYKRAVGAMLHLPGDAVTACLAFTAIGRAVSV